MEEVPTWPTTRRGVVLGGAPKVNIAGIAMAVFIMISSAIAGRGFWTPIELFGAVFTNPRSSPGAAFVYGAVLHLLISATLGIIFASFIRYSTWVVALVFGAASAIVVWGIVTWVGLPLFDSGLSRLLRAIALPWFLAHVVFGVTLAITPRLVSQYSRPQVVAQRVEGPEIRRAA